MRNRRLYMALILLALGATQAQARCRPLREEASPVERARYLLDVADRVGFAVVTTSANSALKRVEGLEMLFPLKGAPGAVRMAPGWRGDQILLGSIQTSAGAPEGSIIFVALSETADGATVTECIARATAPQHRSALIHGLFELARERRR